MTRVLIDKFKKKFIKPIHFCCLGYYLCNVSVKQSPREKNEAKNVYFRGIWCRFLKRQTIFKKGQNETKGPNIFFFGGQPRLKRAKKVGFGPKRGQYGNEFSVGC